MRNPLKLRAFELNSLRVGICTGVLLSGLAASGSSFASPSLQNPARTLNTVQASAVKENTVQASTVLPSTEARPITAEDYFAMVQISNPQLSPDGQFAVLTQRTVNENKRGFDSNIWMVEVQDPSSLRQFTYSDADYQAVWSPDGQYLLINSGRNDSSGLYRLRVRGGEAEPLLTLEQGSISDYQWLPSGDQLLLTIRVDSDVDDPMAKADAEKDEKPDVMEATHAVYKTQGRYLEYGSERSLWLYDLNREQLTALNHGDGFDANDVQISPDGTRFLFASNRHQDALEGAYSQSLFVLDMQGNETPLEAPPGRASQARWVDDNTIVYLHSAQSYAPTSLYRLDLERGTHEQLIAQMELAPGGMQVLNGALYFVADERGSRPLHRLDLTTLEITRMDGQGYSLGQLDMNEHGYIATREHEAMLPELYFKPWHEGPGHQRLTAFNRELTDLLTLSRYQRFTVSGSSGHATDGFFLEPLNRSADQSYPLILNIKGGPGGMWGHQFMQEMQLMAARGYAVVFVNYRGSSGSGQDFSDQVRVDYGGADYEDNMLAVDYVLENYDWVDAERLFVTGGSHGGFLTNWITTQTDRFKAAVTQRSVSNWISEAGTQAFPPASMRVEFGGTIWENFDYYWGRSPLKYADQVTTPTLIIHSTDDHITPIGQGEEWFYALKANNVETEMVVFRGEGHGLSRSGRPINLVERLNRIIDWFDRYDN